MNDQPQGFPSFPKNWQADFEKFPSADTKEVLFGAHFSSREKREGLDSKTLIIVHGLGEHLGRYLHFPYYLNEVVGSIYCFDHRGHGRSSGIRGHISSFNQYLDDLALVIQKRDQISKQKWGRSEIHLLGHSLGGLISLRTLLLKLDLPVMSATFSAPLLGVRLRVPWIKKKMGEILSSFWGSLTMSSKLDAGVLSHDPEVAKAYLSDPLVHQKVTPRFYTELTSVVADTSNRVSELKVPSQFLVPQKDFLVDPDATLKYYEKLQSQDKHLKTYSEFFHEPFNEVGKEQVFEDLARWIKLHSLNS